jgi:GTP cyclohydrolase I
MDKDLIEKGVCLILDGITEQGSWISNPNFKETPERVVRAYVEILSGMEKTSDQIQEVLGKSFPSEYNDNMIFSSDIRTVGMCPHHLMLVKYNITIAYIPDKNAGLVIGASKLARVASILSARPVLQEDLTSDIAWMLEEKIHPMGVAIVISGRHDCMQSRGIRQDRATFETSQMTGNFRSQPETRAEFFSLLANSKR